MARYYYAVYYDSEMGRFIVEDWDTANGFTDGNIYEPDEDEFRSDEHKEERKFNDRVFVKIRDAVDVLTPIAGEFIEEPQIV